MAQAEQDQNKHRRKKSAAKLLSQLRNVASNEVQEGQGIEVLGLLVHLASPKMP